MAIGVFFGIELRTNPAYFVQQNLLKKCFTTSTRKDEKNIVGRRTDASRQAF